MPIRPISKSAVVVAPAVAESTKLEVRSRHRAAEPAKGDAAGRAGNSAGPSRGRAPTRVPPKIGKKTPVGDYPVGYCRPPVATRFDGSRPGPGRPHGALSQDTLLKKHLTQVRPVAIEGRQTRMQNRELVLMMRMKEALSGDRHAADYVLAQAARLFSDRAEGDGKGAALPADIDAHDRAILDTLEAALLARAIRDDGIDEDAGGDGIVGDDTDGEDRS